MRRAALGNLSLLNRRSSNLAHAIASRIVGQPATAYYLPYDITTGLSGDPQCACCWYVDIFWARAKVEPRLSSSI
ncbi:hypothetical protein AFLA_008000 [Aspergillus flavus NRRL3357]|nr:hypothetical protein AFLA_008000 [Aspergillus flavus NRRL3357]